jgi:hypothetical protein
MLALLVDGQRLLRFATHSDQLDPLLVIRAGQDRPDLAQRSPTAAFGQKLVLPVVGVSAPRGYPRTW